MKYTYDSRNWLNLFKLPRILCVVALLFCGSVAAEPQKIVIPPWGNTTSQQSVYVTKLLKLVLDKTANTDGPANIQMYPSNLSLARFMSDLKDNRGIDVIWSGTSKQKEAELLPIYISLLKNLNEYRVLLIRREDQKNFLAVSNVDDLRKFTAGSCEDWPSTSVLRFNDLPVITVNEYELLFPMLRAKRFDYMSRNLFEAWEEEKLLEKDGLVIEKSLLLHGGVPYYFFVNKNNKALADRITRGLKIALADGSFDKLFFSTLGFQRGNDEINSRLRKLLELKVEYY